MMPGPRFESFAAGDRGASEVVGVALLIGIVILGIAAILLVSTPQLDATQTTVEVGQAEQALVQFDSEASRVATGGTTTQQVDLGLRVNRGTLDVQNDTGHITVEYVDFFDNGSSTEVMNTSLGTVIYERDDTTVGYQGGGVWRSDGNGSVMVSPPEVTFRGKTLTMPIVTTRGTSVYSTVQITRERPDERFPNSSANLTNKVKGAQIKVTVQSRYYKAWGAFFEAATGVIVQYNHEQERVTVVFLALPRNLAADAGIIATSGPGEIRLEGTGAYVDSYNSSEAPYESSKSTAGVVKAAGDITMKGDSQIDGDAHAGVDISVGSDSVIDGDAYANGTIEVDGDGTITGSQTENASTVPEIPPIDQLVADKTAELRNQNDNNQTAVIEGNELRVDEKNNTLGPGRYYLHNLHLEGETLELNVTEGNITIGVRDWVVLEKTGGDNSHIDVVGNGTVRFFVASEAKRDVSVPGSGQAPTDLDKVHFFVERNGTIDVPGDRSVRFQVLAPDHFTGAIGGSSAENANVTAAVIAPAGPEGSGQFYVQQGELYGAVITGNLTLGQYGQVHFDRALLNQQIPLAPHVPRLEYLYLTEYHIEVKSS